jgi:hypothetical protein
MFSNTPSPSEFEFWEVPQSVEYDHLMGFKSDSIFYTQVYVSLAVGEVRDVRCNCDSFQYPDPGESALKTDNMCQHAISAVVIASHEMNTDVIQSSSTEFLPLPECLDHILD